MGNIGQDANTLFEDFIRLLVRMLIAIWNLLMQILIAINLMPLFKKHPKALAGFIILLMFLTAPIALFWIMLGIVALINTEHMKEGFIIDKDFNRGNDEELNISNVEDAHIAMEEFHTILSDTILHETGKGLSQHPEILKTSFIMYEIQASLVVAREHKLEWKYHTEFAASVLNRGGIPAEEAKGMVDGVLNAPIGITEWSKGSIDGESGYNQLCLGTDQFIQHIKDTLVRLKGMQQVLD